MSTCNAERSLPATTVLVSAADDHKDDSTAEVARLAGTGVDSATMPRRWTSSTDTDTNVEKSNVDELRAGLLFHSTSRSAAPPLYAREFVDYDYNCSSYPTRYAPFQTTPSSSYPMTPYAAPYSPASLGAYTFNLAGSPSSYNTSYVPHHLTQPSATLLAPERSAPTFRFAATSASLLQSRKFSLFLHA